MANRDLIAIGTSAGGVDALLQIAAKLSPDLPAAVLVTLHISAQFKSELDGILSRAGPLPAQFAGDGEVYRKNRIYIAPPDRHLLAEGDQLRLGSGPRENNTRPAIDPMLRSAAVCCGSRSIGVVLTGTLGDGASGLWAVDQCGGISVVQDPEDAKFAEMPLNALTKVTPDHVARLADIPALLDHLARQPAGEPVAAPDSLKLEVNIARGVTSRMEDMDGLGRRSVLTCPDCQGVMWEIDEGELVRYRCHVGHAYTAEVMSLAIDENLRRALASAVRALEERLTLARKLQKQAERERHALLAANWRDKAEEFHENLTTVRAAIRRMDDLKLRSEALEAAK
jgi:two-component system, chemotaxis family, protein-glutamate methylesterase/glutaminase